MDVTDLEVSERDLRQPWPPGISVKLCSCTQARVRDMRPEAAKCMQEHIRP